jgi:hypothetical protein
VLPRRRRGLVARALAALAAIQLPAFAQAEPTLVVNTLADLAAPCAQLCSLRGAMLSIPDGGTITFDPAILPGTIVLQGGALQNLNKSLRISGPGAALLAIDGADADRLFTTTASVAISGVTLANGRTPVGSAADGAAGTGEPGGSGAYAQGGCIQVFGALTLSRVTLRHCIAQGAAGGAGGTGTTNDAKGGGAGGAGGNGGEAFGGAIYVNYLATLVVSQTSIVDAHAIAGNGGKGGNGGSGAFAGNGGDGGNGGRAFGGAIYVFSPSSVKALNLAIGQSTAQGGKGGNGGGGDPDYFLSYGGDGGDGGNASGGALAIDLGFMPPAAPDTVYFAFTTLGEDTIAVGLHGSGGRAKNPGSAGADGTAYGAALLASSSGYAPMIDNSAVFGTSAQDLCFGSIGHFYPNLASDTSCGNAFFPVAGLAESYLPLDLASPLPAHVPRFASPAIDGVPCAMLTSSAFPIPTVASDVRQTPRPQGATCDFGAIEADYVFAGDFE